MAIYHMPVVATAVNAFNDTAPIVNLAPEGGIIEQAIKSAIQSAIVEPFKALCITAWGRFMTVSYVLCLGTTIGGVLFALVGIKKGKKVAVIAVMTYLCLQILNWIMLG